MAELKDNINTMIGNLRADHRAQHRAGLAEDQPRALHQHAAGPARPARPWARCCCPRLAPLVGAQQGVIYQMDRRRAARPAAAGRPSPTTRLEASRRALRMGEGLVGQCALEQAPRILLDRPAADDDADQLGACSRPCRVERGRAAGVVRGPGQGRDRARLPRPRSRDCSSPSSSSSPPRSASCSTPSRPPCRPRALLKQSQQLAAELQSQQSELQQTNEQLEQKAQQLAEQQRRGGTQEPGNRAGPPRAGGEGDRAGADLEVQVRVPGQHVARAAHAAELAS